MGWSERGLIGRSHCAGLGAAGVQPARRQLRAQAWGRRQLLSVKILVGLRRLSDNLKELENGFYN
jgi:hypothetical protein